MILSSFDTYTVVFKDSVPIRLISNRTKRVVDRSQEREATLQQQQKASN